MAKGIKVFTPAILANVWNAFDIPGFALNLQGGEMVVIVEKK